MRSTSMFTRAVGCLAVVGLAIFHLACTEEAAPGLVARQVTEASDLFAGTDAVGGVGDWLLANDVVEVIVDGVDNQNGLAPSGGTVVDYALRGAGNDQFNQMYQVVMFSQNAPIAYDTLTAEVTDTAARIRVRGQVVASNHLAPISSAVAESFEAVTVYELRRGDSSLYVETTLTNQGTEVVVGDAAGLPISDVLVWGERSLQAFAWGRGFDHPPLDVTNPIAALGGFHFVAARGEADPPVSYGILTTSEPLATVWGVNVGEFSGLGQRPFPGDSLAPGESITYERQLLIAGERTIDAIARQAYAILHSSQPTLVSESGVVRGRVEGLAPLRMAAITASRASDGRALTSTTTRADGTFEITVPSGDVLLRGEVGALALSVPAAPVTVVAGKTIQLPPIAAPAMATLGYRIVSDGAAKPARLTLKGVGDTPDPKLGLQFTGAVSRNVAYSLTGAGSLAVEPGVYDVYASRGLEYSLGHRRVELTAGASLALEFSLRRVLDTGGYVSGDFHVHSVSSFDSSIDHDTRVLTYAAEGVQVLVSTEHDQIADLAPAAERLGLQRDLATVVGLESTGFAPTPELPYTAGHHNVWPMRAARGVARGGAPKDEKIEPGELYERLRGLAVGRSVIQLNHPRATFTGSVGLGYFSNFGFDPTKPVPDANDGGVNGFLRRKSGAGTDNLGFNTIEVINGASWESLFYTQQNRVDWLALLRQGILRTGMANSDSHQVAVEAAGFPRSYVRYAGDLGDRLDVDAFNEAILEMRVVGTSGPFFDVSIDGSQPGGTVQMDQPGVVTVRVRVQAAPWVPVEQISVLVNGDLACRIGYGNDVVVALAGARCPAGLRPEPTDPYGTEGVVRYDGAVDLPIRTDAFVIVEAGSGLPKGADLDADGVLDTWDVDGNGVVDSTDADLGGFPTDRAPVPASHLVPGLIPWGFTNPIFLKVGSGDWSPPGLAGQ